MIVPRLSQVRLLICTYPSRCGLLLLRKALDKLVTITIPPLSNTSIVWTTLASLSAKYDRMAKPPLYVFLIVQQYVLSRPWMVQQGPAEVQTIYGQSGCTEGDQWIRYWISFFFVAIAASRDPCFTGREGSLPAQYDSATVGEYSNFLTFHPWCKSRKLQNLWSALVFLF